MYMYANLLHYDDNPTFHTARAGDASTSKSSGGTADSSHSNTGMLLRIKELGLMTLSSIITVTECDLLLCLSAHASKAYSSRFVCLSVTLISRQWLKIKCRRMQYNNNISYIIVLDF